MAPADLRIVRNGEWRSYSGGAPIPPGPPGPLIVGADHPSESYYPLPAGPALYVSPSGDNANPGTIEQPKRTIAAAQAASPVGGTIVIRGGNYHESFTFNKALRYQKYLDEEVWMDGSVVYSSWTGSGPWTAPLGPRWSAIDSDRYPHADPAANLPEQVWVDGVALRQLPDGTTPAAGQFSVNRTAWTVTIGTNPAGKEVRVAELEYAGVVSQRIEVYGIGFRRYSPQEVEGSNSALLYFGGSSQTSILENVVLQDSGMHGFATARPLVIRKLTIQDCMQSGAQVTTANGFSIDNFVIRRCNRGLWNFQPITAGIKFNRTRELDARNGLIYDVPRAAGFWMDTFVPQYMVVNVHVDGGTNYTMPNGTPAARMEVGIHPEAADGGLFGGIQHYGWIVSCSARNARAPMKFLCSGWSYIANSVIDDYDLAGMYFQQDGRRNDGSKPDEGTAEQSPWLTLHHSLLNSELGVGARQVIAYQDPVAWSPAQLGWDVFDRIEGNWFRPAPPGTMVELGTASGARVTFNSLPALASSGSNVGGPPGAKLGVNHQGSNRPGDSIAVELPEAIASTIGIVPAATRRVGLLFPVPEPSF